MRPSIDTTSPGEHVSDASMACIFCRRLQNEKLRHTYRTCYFCRREVTPAAALVDEYKSPSGRDSLVILAAAYGHFTDPNLAYDVTDAVARLVKKRSKRSSVLFISAATDMTQLFGDPCPGSIKALKLRYRSYFRRGEAHIVEGRPGHLQHDLLMRILKDSPPALTIVKATYGVQGDPAGLLDVTERVCGIADIRRGDFLEILSTTDLTDLFGVPPCGEDRKKHLTIHYEIEGSSGRVEQFSCDDHLLSPIAIDTVPTLEPLIIITSAMYGRTREMLQERTKEIRKELQHSSYGASGAAHKRVEHLKQLQKELESLLEDQIRTVDATWMVQRRVEAAGGDLLCFTPDEDLNKAFTNPCPGMTKELRIKYLCMGSDADQTTSSEEVTTRGHPRNVIAHVKGEVKAQVVDDEKTGQGCLLRELRVKSQKAFPLLDVISAKHGPPLDYRRTRDVTADIRRLVLQQGGDKLIIGQNQSLEQIFGKCYSSGRKKFVIVYLLRGIVGVLRVDEDHGKLRSTVRLGYKTAKDKAPPSDLDGEEDVGKKAESTGFSLPEVEEKLAMVRRSEPQPILNADMTHAQHRHCNPKRPSAIPAQPRRDDGLLASRIMKGQMLKTQVEPGEAEELDLALHDQHADARYLYGGKKEAGPKPEEMMASLLK